MTAWPFPCGPSCERKCYACSHEACRRELLKGSACEWCGRSIDAG